MTKLGDMWQPLSVRVRCTVLANIDEGHDPELHCNLSRVKATLDGFGLVVHKLHLPYQPFCMPDEMLLALQKEGFKHYFSNHHRVCIVGQALQMPVC